MPERERDARERERDARERETLRERLHKRKREKERKILEREHFNDNKNGTG